MKTLPYLRTLWACMLAVILLGSSGCGYTLRGQEGSKATDSVLGTGSSTLRIQEIEQTTLYPWLGYAIRSQLRDEISARGMASWVDNGPADYGLGVHVKSFRVNAYGQSRSQNLLFTASLEMEMLVYDGRTNTVVWRSGPISRSETYQNVNEEEAIRQTLQGALVRAVDRMQRRF